MAPSRNKVGSSNQKPHTSNTCFLLGNLLLSLSLLALVGAYIIRKWGLNSARELHITKKEESLSYLGLGWFSFRSQSEEPVQPSSLSSSITNSVRDGIEWIFDCLDYILDSTTALVSGTVHHISKLLEYCAAELKDFVFNVQGSLNRSGSLFPLVLSSAIILLASLFAFVAFFRCCRQNKSKQASGHTFTDHVDSALDRGEGPRIVGIEKCTFCEEGRTLRSTSRVKTFVLVLVVMFLCLSIPWEFVRMYQHEVATKATVVLKGMPAECVPSKLGVWQTVTSWIMWHLTWTPDPCEQYHRALMVDPLWEVNPGMVVSSVFARCVTKPFEVFCASLGQCLRLLFSEVPSQWQPVLMVTIIFLALLASIMCCRYKVTIPLGVLHIEPGHKTPVRNAPHTCCSSSPDDARRNPNGREIAPTDRRFPSHNGV